MYETDNIYTINNNNNAGTYVLQRLVGCISEDFYSYRQAFESESGFKDALTGIYLKLGTTTLYAGDLTYAYLDELAGLYSDYPGYNTNAVFDQSIVFDYENMFLSKKNGIYSTMYNIIANINNFLEYVDKK